MSTRIQVFYITGKQLGPISVPHSWCEECDATVRLVQRIVEELGPQTGIEFEAKPWIRYAFEALRMGGWHAPVVTIDGRVFSQGVVPDREALLSRLAGAATAGPGVR